jgi:hypothetical protein
MDGGMDGRTLRNRLVQNDLDGFIATTSAKSHRHMKCYNYVAYPFKAGIKSLCATLPDEIFTGDFTS